jgi:hypothetical protein
MLSEVTADFQQRGFLAPFWGPIKGVPYKIYAVQTPAQGLGLGSFLPVSIPARLMRFVLLTRAVCLFCHTLLGRWAPHQKVVLLVSLWGAFYAWYVLSMLHEFR